MLKFKAPMPVEWRTPYPVTQVRGNFAVDSSSGTLEVLSSVKNRRTTCLEM